MKRSALLVLSSLLLTSASYAGNTKCEDCYDLSTKNAAALHHTVSQPNSQESKYWDDFLDSGNKDITVYVRDLSRKDAQAALWFITTGGKHGFAARQATAQERTFLEDAIKQVALSYSQQGVKSGRGLQEWSQVSNANHAGHLHLQMIYKQIDDLKDEVNNLNVRVNLLEKAQEASNKKYDKIYEKLKAESEERTAADAKLATQKTEADAKLVAQQLADKTAADVEKAKVQAEVDRQKDRKKFYKDQVIDYRLKAIVADKEKAVTDAVKIANEAAAKALRDKDEEIRKEREAAAKEREAAAEREKTLLQRLAAFEASQTNAQTGIGNNTANNNNSSSSPFQERKQGMQETRQYEVYTTVKATAKAERTASQNG